MLVPDSTKAFKLYTGAAMPDAVQRENAKKRAFKDMKKGGGLIVQ